MIEGEAVHSPRGDADSIVSLFLEQARRTPEACALTLEDAGMAYGQHAHRSSVVARFLRASGAVAGSRLVPRRLPAEAVPTSLFALDALPLTSSGKLDRAALPRLSAASDDDKPVFAEANDIEAAVARAWEEVLSRPSARQDSFFDLGGKAFSAMRVMLRLRREFGIEIPISTLFEHPTIRGISAWLASQIREEAEAPMAVMGGPRSTTDGKGTDG